MKYVTGLWSKFTESDLYYTLIEPYYKMRRAVSYVRRYHYYGKVGTECFEFDASGAYTLMHAHLDITHKFLCDKEKTHLACNGNPDSKKMRRLAELRDLSLFMSCGCVCSDNWIATYKNMFGDDIGMSIFNKMTPSQVRRLKAASKRDTALAQTRRERFFKLLKTLNDYWD